MNEILGNTRFGDVVLLFSEIRNGLKFYYDISAFSDRERNYDVYALLNGLVSTAVWRRESEAGLGRLEVFEVLEISRRRISEADFAVISEAMGHRTSVAVSAYGRTLLHSAFRNH